MFQLKMKEQADAGEHIEQIVPGSGVRIERIVSKGHTSPESGWYDQSEDEWVMVLQGRGNVLFEQDGAELEMGPGDWCEIPAHCRHRVSWTDPDQETIWLAVHYPGRQKPESRE